MSWNISFYKFVDVARSLLFKKEAFTQRHLLLSLLLLMIPPCICPASSMQIAIKHHSTRFVLYPLDFILKLCELEDLDKMFMKKYCASEHERS